MRRTTTGPVVYLLAALLGMAGMPAVVNAAVGYDVSYVWSNSLDGVRDYRKKVIGVLGRSIAKHLKVVTRNNLIGLVYVRHGDSDGATRVARSHSRLLTARGLDAASPVRSENWTHVGSAGSNSVVAVSPATGEIAYPAPTTCATSWMVPPRKIPAARSSRPESVAITG